MITHPTLYLTNAQHALRRTPGLAGPGNVWSIMARPRVKFGEAGHGRCWPLVPDPQALDDVRAALNVAKVAAQVNFDDQRSAVAREHDVPELQLVGGLERPRESEHLVKYRTGYLDGPARRVDGETVAPCRARHPDLGPGKLFAKANASGGLFEVRSGDTLICACSVDKARAGECHRVWAAALLAQAEWCVVLDGRAVDLRAESAPRRCA